MQIEEEHSLHFIGKIDKHMYQGVTSDIVTDEVIITDERIEHIKNHHPNDYERYQSYLSLMVESPDYIIADERPNTALVLKEIFDENTNECFRLALRLATSSDCENYKNSILTFWKTREKEYSRLIKNKNILYKSK